MRKIAIIGAGISGLSIAHLLKDYAKIILFEKARGVGGRMSTRRAEPYFFDHGAQYFTARTKPFQNFIKPLIKQDIIKRWDARYIKFKGNQIIQRKNWSTEEPRYVARFGMNQVGKFLAKELDIRINTKITSIKRENSKWQLMDDQEQNYSDFDWVICTAPSPQAEDLLPKSFLYYNDIKNAIMSPCLSLMLGFEKPISLDFDAAHVSDSDVSWIATNKNKQEQSDFFTLMVHSSEKYAESYIDYDPEKIIQHLITETNHIIGYDVNIANYKTLHKWRYANNAKTDKINNVLLDQKHQLAACGDWCYGGRVEGAFTSAYNLSLKMKESVL